MEKKKLTQRLQSQPGTYEKRECPGATGGRENASLLVSRPEAGISKLLGEIPMEPVIPVQKRRGGAARG